MAYSKRISKAQRNAIKVNRKAVRHFSADIEVQRTLTLAKRSADVKVS